MTTKAQENRTDELSLEETIALATRVKDWTLEEEVVARPIEENLDGWYVVGYEDKVAYRGTFKELTFHLAMEQDSRHGSTYHLNVAYDNKDIAEHSVYAWRESAKPPELKVFFDAVHLRTRHCSQARKQAARLNAILVARSYLAVERKRSKR